MNTTTPTTTAALDQLNALLRGERAAVEMYEQAISTFPKDPIPALDANLRCHGARIPVLTARIHQLGGLAAQTSGAWGVVGQVAEGGAKLFGQGTAVAVLAAGENKGLDDYRASLDHLDAESAHLIRSDLLPAQERTQKRLELLKNP